MITLLMEVRHPLNFHMDCKLEKQVPELRYPGMHVHVRAHTHRSPFAIT